MSFNAASETPPAEALRRAYTPSAVVAALSRIGVAGEDLSLATGADERTVRRWAKENNPRPTARDALDRLRIVVLYLLQRRAMPTEEISSWLKARSLELGPDPEIGVRRPVDAIRHNDIPAVFSAINALIRTPASGPVGSADSPTKQITPTENTNTDAWDVEFPAPAETAADQLANA